MSLFQRYNNENLLVRAIIAGLLDVLNNHIRYNQIWGNDPIEDIETINVPWFYNQSGDERFMQDFYTHYAHCVPPRPADGNFDMIPRGVITYTGSGINAQRITSRYVQGRYVKEIDGKLEGFVSYLYSIPVDIRFDCEIWADTHTTALKIEQEIREFFYKTVTYYVYYKGMRVGCTAGFPEDYLITKNINYSFESENKVKMTFQLAVESYQPVFDPTTEMPARNSIKRFTYRLYDKFQKSDGAIEVLSPPEGITVPKGTPLWIEWSFTKEGGIMKSIDLYWTHTGKNDYYEIDLVQPNHEYYIWNIPEDFTNFKEPGIIWDERPDLTISRKPHIRVIPDDSGLIDSSSFYVLSEGYFLSPSEDTSVNIQLEMKDSAGKVSYTADGDIWANIRWNKLDLSNPITVNPDSSIVFPGNMDHKTIDIIVANSVDNDVYGRRVNIKIV